MDTRTAPIVVIDARPRARERARGAFEAWPLPAAAVLHLAVLCALLLMPAPPSENGMPADAVAVEIISPSDLAHLSSPPAEDSAPLDAESLPTDRPPAGQPTAPRSSQRSAPQPKPEMIRPTTMLSSRSLGDPRSRQARLAMRDLSEDDRVEQLCDLEAMEQVAAWRKEFRPDRLVAYAMGEPKAAGDVIEADGGAFRSRSLWYAIRYRCELTSDHRQVKAFAFAVGAPVPREEWNDRGLPAVH